MTTDNEPVQPNKSGDLMLEAHEDAEREERRRKDAEREEEEEEEPNAGRRD